MNLKYFYIIASIVIAFLLFLSVGYDGWGCGGSAFSGACKHSEKMRTVGALLLTAGILIALVAVFVGLQLANQGKGMGIAAAVVVIASTILSMAGVFYYYDQTSLWSPFIAVIGMTISFVLTVLLVIDLVNG